MSQVFISYSRKDKSFVEQLSEALTQLKRDIWVDWNNIPPTAKWLQEIYEGIEAADNFVFVISPDSISSEVCKMEIDHATQHNKRFIPLIFREVKASKLPDPIATHNWIDFRLVSDFQKSFDKLLSAIDTDLEYVRTHTQILLKAQEWSTYGKDRSYLLTGSELSLAEQWLLRSTDKQPQPTPLQQEFIGSSLHAEKESEEEKKTRQLYLAIRDKALKGYIRPYLDQRRRALEEQQEALKQRALRFSAEQMAVDEELSGLMNFLDLGGKWHPKEPRHVGNLGPQEDYLEVFEFACCGKKVIADRPPSQFRSDGCQEAPALAEGDR